MSSITVPAGAARAASARRGRGVPPLIFACLVFIAALVVLAAIGRWIAPHDATAQDLGTGLSKPSGAHWLGTDDLGRDVFSRLIVGSRGALVGPLLIALSSMLVGNALGLLAGYRGGRVDAVIMRLVDLMWAIPSLLILIVAASAIGGGYWLAVGLLIVLTIPFDTRVVRGATLEQVPRPYVEAAKTLGVPDRRIMLRHIWPNVAPVAVANAFLVYAGALVTLASLSYLGLGADPGTPDWGLMLADGQALLFANPVSELAPGVMIVLTAASMNLIGDWLYESLSSRGAGR
jgi:peptide/nickel transport system permease protein